MQLLFVGFQLGKGHRPIGTHPVWRIVRFTRLQLFDIVNRHAAAAEQNIALGYPLRRLQQVFVIPPEDHQQLDVRIIRVVDHFNRRRLNRRVLAQEVRALIVSRENNGVTVRQLVELDRELLAAPARLAAEPGGDNGRRLLLQDIRRGGEDHRQRQLAVIARIVERHREMRKIVAHVQRLVG